jgi:hypothetical protein
VIGTFERHNTCQTWCFTSPALGSFLESGLIWDLLNEAIAKSRTFVQGKSSSLVGKKIVRNLRDWSTTLDDIVSTALTLRDAFRLYDWFIFEAANSTPLPGAKSTHHSQDKTTCQTARLDDYALLHI